MIQARIAGLSVQLEGGDPAFFPTRFSEYEAPVDQADLTLSMTRLPELTEPEGERIVQTDSVTLSRAANGDLYRYTFGRKTGKILHICRYAPDYAAWSYTLWEGRKHTTLSLTDFEYLYSGEAFASRLAQLGGLVMHGSAVAFDGKGVIFSAPSGTGKSTHAGLWKQQYGERVIQINDDKPAIRFVEDVPYVYGTPWSGKTDVNANVKAPLGAIVFLKQAPQNRIQPLPLEEAILHIHRETVRPFYDEALGLKVLDTTERLLRSVPAYLLECNISAEAVELVKHTLAW